MTIEADMSVEEDTELRDIVLDTLETRGVVGHVKAMLRAHIFTALEENALPEDKIYLLNKKIKEQLSTTDGKLMMNLILDYFSCFDLEFTKSVFIPETGFSGEQMSRSEISKKLGVTLPSAKQPILVSLINREENSISGADSPRRRVASSIPSDLSAKQIADAKFKFTKYDKDGSDTIDKDELRELFIEMFPDFHPNMLERYLTDEFRAADRDFSAGIDFNEFLDLYRRLFVSCRSIVSGHISDIVTPRSPSPKQQSKIPVKMEGNKKESPTVTNKSSLTNASKSTTSQTKPNSGDGLTDVKSSKDQGKNNNAKEPVQKTSPLTVNKELADLGFDVPEDDEESIKTKSGYDDDFERSNASSSSRLSKKSPSEAESMNSIQTADSFSSDDSTENINDDDDLDALLKDNEVSVGNKTTDTSVSDDESFKGADYWETAGKT